MDKGSTLIHLVVGVALGEETDEDPTREEAYSIHIMHYNPLYTITQDECTYLAQPASHSN